MPSHVYIRTGQYAEGSEANRKAITVDAAAAHNLPIYGMYVAHNFQFLWATTLMEGRSVESLQAARDMMHRVSLEMLKGMPGLDYLLSYPMVGLARFGRWKELLAEPAPPADFSTALGIWHAVRGLALLKTGDLDGAGRELAEVEALLKGTPSEAKEGTNSARDVLSIAADMLGAELTLAHGDVPTALMRFERAVATEDALLYDEPPDWVLPVRHQLGAALLRTGRPRQAEAVYRADLERHPHNGWALFGLFQSLETQGKTAEAAEARQAFTEAWKNADVQLTASAF